MSDNTPATPPAGTVLTQVVGAPGDVTWVFDTATGAFAPLGGIVPQSPAFPSLNSSSTAPVPGTQSVVFGTAARFVAVPVNTLGSNNAEMPDPNKLTLVLPNRYLSRIKEKRGIANINVFDRKTGTKQYNTASFFASNVSLSLSEATSITKTNEGFTLYSPDHNPTVITLTGTLLSGDDWTNANRPGRIGHTDWFSKLLTDYRDRLSSTSAINNNTDIWFSYEYVYANVYITNMQVGTSADSPTAHNFSMTMVVRTGMVISRPDLDGSGPDEPEAGTEPGQESAQGVATSNGTGTAPTGQINGQGATPSVTVSDTIGAWTPDGRLNPLFASYEAPAVAAAITTVYQESPQ